MRPESSATNSPKAREVSKTPKIPANAKKARKAAEALGFEVFTENRMIHKPATLRKKATEQHAAGSVLHAAKDIDTHFMNARHMALPEGLAFQAIWGDGFSGRIVDKSGGKEVELRGNYYMTKTHAEGLGYTVEQAEKFGQERDYRYNDGGTYIIDRWKVSAWGEFTEWIDGLIDALHVDTPKISTVRKAPKKKTEEDIMHELLNPKIDFSVQ